MLTSWGNVLTWMDPGCCFSGTTALGFWFSGCSSLQEILWFIYLAAKWKAKGPCFALCREAHFLLSGQDVPKGAGASEDRLGSHLPRCASLVIGGVVVGFCSLGRHQSSGKIASLSSTYCSSAASLLLQLCWCYREQWLTVGWGRGEWMQTYWMHISCHPFWTQLCPVAWLCTRLSISLLIWEALHQTSGSYSPTYGHTFQK